jgi:hypothetical protein
MYSALDVSISYFTSNLAFLKVQNTNETNTQKKLILLMGHSIASQAHEQTELELMNDTKYF